MTMISLEAAQAQLAQLISGLRPGDEIVITKESQPVARLTSPIPTQKLPRKLGTLKGSVLFMSPDFDAPLDDFKEYMA